MLHARTAPAPGAPARLPELLSETVPTLLVGPDRLGMEGLRSILRDTRFRVVDSRDRITGTCPGLREEAMTVLILVAGTLGPAEAALCAALVRGWHPGHRILAVLDGHPEDPLVHTVFDGVIDRNSLGDQIVEAMEQAQDAALRRHLRNRLLSIPAPAERPDSPRAPACDRLRPEARHAPDRRQEPVRGGRSGLARSLDGPRHYAGG